MSEFHSQWLKEQPETPENRTDKTDKTPGPVPCEHPLHLPESKAIGRCIRCQSEEQFVDTLARMRIRRERTARAVDARARELEVDA